MTLRGVLASPVELKDACRPVCPIRSCIYEEVASSSEGGRDCRNRRRHPPRSHVFKQKSQAVKHMNARITAQLKVLSFRFFGQGLPVTPYLAPHRLVLHVGSSLESLAESESHPTSFIYLFIRTLGGVGGLGGVGSL